jgi:DNA-binding beta-propeller fold protein YncE
MKHHLAIAGLLAAAFSAAGAPPAHPPTPPILPATQKAIARYAVVGSVKLGGEGPWGHVAQDPQRNLLYVLSTDWMRIMDAATEKTIAEVGVGNGARGIMLVPEAGRGFVSNGWGQTVSVFDLKTNAVLGLLKFDHETEAIVYDPSSRHMFVALGDGHCVVPFASDIDVKIGKTDRPIDLDGVPVGVVPDGQGMVYVTLVDKDQVAVIDTREMRLMTTWPLPPESRPTGISMDRIHGRLFVACSSGVLVLSAADGHVMAHPRIKGGTDATAFFGGQVFASSSDGTFTVIGQNAAGEFSIIQSLPTGFRGANMNGSNPTNAMIMNPKTGAIYLPASESARGVGKFKLLILRKQ